MRVRVTVPTAGYLGDMRYSFVYTSVFFSQMNIGVRISYFIVSIIVLIVWLVFIVRKFASFDDWPIEIRACLALIMGLQLFNNPIHPVEYFDGGFILPFINAELELAFILVLIVFWMYQIDALRGSIEAPTLLGGVWQHRGKVVLLGIFGALASGFFLWESISVRLTPIFGISEHVSGIQILFYFTSVSYAVLIVWIAMIIIMTIPKAFSHEHMSVRYLFFAVPTSLLIVSMLIGIFSGNLISFGRSSINFMFFHTVMQCYVYLTLWGFWPQAAGYQNMATTASETSNIFDARSRKAYSNI